MQKRKWISKRPSKTRVLNRIALASAQDVVYIFDNVTLTGPETLSVNGYQNSTFVNNSDAEVDMSLLRLRR